MLMNFSGIFEVRASTYEEQETYLDSTWLYKNTGVLSNTSEYIRVLENKPTESLYGYKIRNVHMINASFWYYVCGSNAAFDEHYCSVFIRILKNAAEVGFSYAYLQGWVPPEIAPDPIEYFFTEDYFTEGISDDYLFINMSTNTTSTTYAYIICCYIYVNWGYDVYGDLTSTFIDKIVYFIPLFILLFIVPISLYAVFGKMGFIISLILMSILAIMTSMIDLSMGIVVILSEIIIMVIIYKKGSAFK